MKGWLKAGGGGEIRYKGKLSDTFDPAPVTVVCSGGRKRAPAYKPRPRITSKLSPSAC